MIRADGDALDVESTVLGQNNIEKHGVGTRLQRIPEIDGQVSGWRIDITLNKLSLKNKCFGGMDAPISIHRLK